MKKKIAFYSHIPISELNHEFYTPSFIGKYIDEIASFSDELHLFAHKHEHDNLFNDYKLNSTKIICHNIGAKTNSLYRFFCGFFYLKDFNKFSFDHLIVRAPTPLFFWFKLFIPQKRLHYLIVADEKDGALKKDINNTRDLFVKFFLLFSDFLFLKCVNGTRSFVNSRALYNKFNKNKNIELVSTSNLTDQDFVSKLNYEFNSTLNLLYVGRLDTSKGILETLDAVKILISKNVLCNYQIVGWDDSLGKNEKVIKEKIEKLNISDYVNLAGKVSHGKKLNNIYRNSDIFIIASYHEGFPRTILESMANSTIVIASSVGAIPIELENDFNVILVEPKNVNSIVDAVCKVVEDLPLRKKIISNAYSYSLTKKIKSGVSNLISKINHENI